MINNIVRNEILLTINRKSIDNIEQPMIIPTIIIPPKNSPDKIIPPGSSINLRNKVVKSPMDKIPNIIFSLRSVFIITDNSLVYG